MLDYTPLREAQQKVEEDRSWECEGEWSQMVFKLGSFLEALGLEIITDYDLEVSGRCSFKDKTIRLNVPHSEGAFLTLAHEAGHWMSWLRYGADDDDAPWAQHERWAYLYGWVVIQKIGAAGLVSKEMWRDHHPYVVGGWSEEQTCQFYNLVEEGLSREDARHRVFG